MRDRSPRTTPSHAYEPIHISARFAASAWAGFDLVSCELWANNGTRRTLDSGQAIARLVAADGQVIAEQTASVMLAPDSATLIGHIEAPMASVSSEVFFLDLALASEAGTLMSCNRYTFSAAANLAPLLRLRQTTLDIVHDGNALTIGNMGPVVALAIQLEDERDVHSPGYTWFSESGFSLLPGESRTVAVEWDTAVQAEHSICVQAWNSTPWIG